VFFKLTVTNFNSAKVRQFTGIVEKNLKLSLCPDLQAITEYAPGYFYTLSEKQDALFR
jgi:hypothetical protein